ncbi:family 5 extracellular solute-binding protein [Alcanivorax balearicus MACL04]|uniref:Family 5 extracellular solute-binding protein n=1 Tax=Alloalcanivorax balearicus MACL04 TaxID=1177182 RepID=A0ABT2R0S4_9GAMM|nr:ABC transporter substrate-binding protein [Alloalcanivorax balearicus]MCU5783376.1 family 5 extracellular solute-binding protein [Alloalcanivorax balearicus MACL04]
MNHHDNHYHNDDDDLIINGVPMGRRAFLGMLSGAVAAGTLMSPSWSWAQAGGQATLTVSAPANPSSLDPATGGSGSDHVLLFPMYDTLVNWNPATLSATPGLAQKWSFPDPKTLVLELRPGVTFHDGTPFNAEAVKTNIDRSRTAEFSNIRQDLSSVDHVEVSGEHVVTLHLKNPDSALPLILSDRAGMMVSPKALADNNNRVDRNPVGAGFMRFQKWDDGSEVAMTRYADYNGPNKLAVGAISFKIITDSATRLRSVMSGQAQMAYHLDGRQKQMIERLPTLQGFADPTIYCYQFYMNMARKPLDDVRVRQAINYAVDRETFVRVAMAGAGEPAYMNLPKSHWAYDPETAKLYSHDPDKARALLKEAGHADGIELDLRGYNDQSSVQMQEVLMEQFSKVGIRGRFRTGTIADMSAAYFGQEKAGHMLLSAWTGRPDPSLSYSLLYSGTSYFNAGQVKPPEGFDQALLDSRSSDDQSQRQQALARVQRIVMENALVVPLAFRQSIVATTAQVQGFENNLLGKPKFNNVSLKA